MSDNTVRPGQRFNPLDSECIVTGAREVQTPGAGLITLIVGRSIESLRQVVSIVPCPTMSTMTHFVWLHNLEARHPASVWIVDFLARRAGYTFDEFATLLQDVAREEHLKKIIDTWGTDAETRQSTLYQRLQSLVA